MANEGGGFNPANFYLGVVELFAIILPGAILTFLLFWSPFLYMFFGGGELSSRPLPKIPAIEPLAFVVISYVTGHILAALGYLVMDPLFEQYFVTRAKRLGILAARAKATINDTVEFGKGRDEEFRLAIAYVNLYSPQASNRLDSLEADCKFFRNLAPTILLGLPLIDSAYNPTCHLAVAIELGLILLFFLYLVSWNRLFSPTKGPFTRIITLLLLILLWVAPMLAGMTLCRPTLPHKLVDIGLYGFMLLAGMRYCALQGKLMTSAYEFLVLLFSRRPDPIISRQDIPKS
jgi:hypothetical protein